MTPRDASSSTESTAARLIDELAAGGEAVDAGQFTLDHAAAADKVEAYAYADRTRYLVPILEGLLGLGAHHVEIRTRLEDLSIATQGVVFDDPPAVCLPSLLTATPTRGPALERLATGLDMLLGGSSTASVRICCSGAATAVAVTYRHQREPELSLVELNIDPLVIEIDNSLLAGLAARPDALAHLRLAVRSSLHEVMLDGDRISGGGPEWFQCTEEQGPGYRLRAGFDRVGEDPSVIELWSQGICVDRHPLPGLAFRAVLELDLLRRDLSRMRVVQDETFERAVAHIERVRVGALFRLDQLDQSWIGIGHPIEWPPDRVDRVLGRPVRRALADTDAAGKPRQLGPREQNRRTWIGAIGFFGYLFVGVGVSLLLPAEVAMFGIISTMVTGFMGVMAWSLRRTK